MHRGKDWSFIKKLEEKLINAIDRIPNNDSDYGFCHGDFHGGGNAHKSPRSIIVFDFDCCGFGFRSYDLSAFRWNALFYHENSDRWDAFIKGYKSKRKITNVDWKLTKMMMLVRDIWIMGLHMGNSEDFGQCWMDNNYIKKHMDFLNAIYKECF